MPDSLAPIVLFVHARPEHARRTLEALASNALAAKSDLWIYADGARNEAEAGRVRAVRDIVRQASGFRSVTLVERESNYGLARNIIEGVSEVCERHGRVIVLEDDVVTSRGFLAFMNAALDRYKDEPRVWHVSGWNYPIDPSGLGDAFFWRAMNCWGWATWSDRWRRFRKAPIELIQAWDRASIARFNLGGAHDFWRQVKENATGQRDTWAIFWYASIFENGGLCLNPARSFVRNIGHDGSGENCGRSDAFLAAHLAETFERFPAEVEESVLAVQRVQAFYSGMRRSFIQQMLGCVRRLASAMGGRW